MAESAEAKIYVVDASSWISIDGHPAANKILYYLTELIERGAIKCPPEVWSEIRPNDYLMAVLKPHRKAIVHRRLRQNWEYLKIVGEVSWKFAAMSGTMGTRNKADPYVVAYAAYRNSVDNPPRCVVV